MMDLDTILENIIEYRADIDSLVRQLKALGIKNLDELKAEAKERGIGIPADIQKTLAERFNNSDEDDWNEAKAANTEEAYRRYLQEHQTGAHRDDARNAIVKLGEDAAAEAGDDEWDKINKNSIDELSRFVSGFRGNAHWEEANKLLQELRNEVYLDVGIKALAKQMKDIRTDSRINNPEKAIYDRIVSYLNSGKIEMEDFMQALREDHNFISSTVANLLWENGYVNDFSQAGIDPDFITYMIAKRTPAAFLPPNKLAQVTKVPCTEVYFWGIPSSGKSCALGAILSAANSGKLALSMDKDPDCQGFGYMVRLANLFQNNDVVGALPEGTAVTSTYEMGFDLEDKDHKVHPITCIDLAGELVRCMFKKDAGEPLSDDQLDVLRTLTDVMVDNRTKNRKIHFFVIEYGAEDRLYEGLPQQDYLQAAVAYIQRTGIFKKDTDGLYVLISKVDKANAVGKELGDKLRDYIDKNYRGFYNGLKRICRENEINGGEVEIIPFTLGEVCFQNYCKFKDKAAQNVVSIILERSIGFKQGKIQKVMDALKK